MPQVSNAKTPEEARDDILTMFIRPMQELRNGLALQKPQEQARRRAALGYLGMMRDQIKELTFAEIPTGEPAFPKREL